MEKKEYWKNKNIFITGTTGLLGPWLINELLEQQANVFALVRDFIPNSLFFMQDLDKKVNIVSGDLLDYSLLQRVLNEFDIDTFEKTKEELQNSFKDFFSEWSPFSYLVDLFNLISEKIFEVSVVSCVICHKKIEIEQQKAAVECPHCERPYHDNCWSQTMQSFGKCGFCLRTPPPSMF